MSLESLVRVKVDSVTQLHQWLRKHHNQSESVWLVYPKKSPQRKISYSEIVDEALCFGWIDSLPRKFDATHTMILLSPRKPKSSWSKVNQTRVKKLELAGRMTVAGNKAVTLAKSNGAWNRLKAVEKLSVPEDLKTALRLYSQAEAYFMNFSPSSRRGILEWINAAKKPETRKMRVSETAKLASRNLKANHPIGRNQGTPLPT